ncbi:ABC transporter ATP-binding protein [Catenulispora pinisilvae]|uniref:ABC transporter ATP-binding protein n=1 Tax=Catenulispora pinisilvae TaxID=2705253 RepID=UPI001890E45E|nr:ABC transporter ATP-binding protein [Catenulispora pinisilvae]
MESTPAEVTSKPKIPDEPRRGAFASLRRLTPFIRPYRGQMVLMTLSALGATLVGVAVPLLTKDLIDGPIAHHNKAALWPLGGLVLLFGIAEAVLFWLRRWFLQRAALGIEADIRNAFYRHLQKLPVAFHDSWQSGQLVSRMSGDINSLRRFFGFALIFLVVNGATFLLVGGALIFIHTVMGLIIYAASVPLILYGRLADRRYHRQSRAAQDQAGDVATLVEESALGIRAVKAFGRQGLLYSRFDEHAKTLRSLELRKIRTLSELWAMFALQPQLVLSLCVLIGAYAVSSGALTLGTLVAFISLYLTLLWPIESMAWLMAQSQEANSAAERVLEVLDIVPNIADAEAVAHSRPASAGELVFENVSFTYPNSDRPVISGFDLRVAAGETVALVGPTGCGKTTLTALVPRLYDTTSGRVLVDGVDVRELPLSELRSKVACAFEDPTLFSASVRENLTMGVPDASQEQVEEALAIAQADFVNELPWALDTRVGEQGLTLSGGQRQRVALARAVLGRPSILVLDDPLSALDIHTEGKVEEALHSVLRGTTGLVVAHRPSTVLLADRVVLLSPPGPEGTTIAAVGTHQELLRTCPAYRDILSQTSDLVDAADESEPDTCDSELMEVSR